MRRTPQGGDAGSTIPIDRLLNERGERVRAANDDVTALGVDQTVLLPDTQLLVHALARRRNQRAEIALRQLDIDPQALWRGAAVILRELEQQAGEPRRD